MDKSGRLIVVINGLQQYRSVYFGKENPNTDEYELKHGA